MMRVLPVMCSVFLAASAGCGGGTSADSTGKDSRPQDRTPGANTGESKLVGTWRFVRSSNNQDPGWGTKLDFTPDGKVTMHGPGYANAGTYALEKNILTIKATVTDTLPVAKLTDRELVIAIQMVGHSDTYEYRKE
jgi:hypothetical protein